MNLISSNFFFLQIIFILFIIKYNCEFLINIFPPSLVNVIQTHSTNCIRGLDIDYVKQYIFTWINKGDLSILDLKEKLIQKISYFCSNIEIRIIRFNPIGRELYTGEQKV